MAYIFRDSTIGKRTVATCIYSATPNGKRIRIQVGVRTIQTCLVIAKGTARHSKRISAIDIDSTTTRVSITRDVILNNTIGKTYISLAINSTTVSLFGIGISTVFCVSPCNDKIFKSQVITHIVYNASTNSFVSFCIYSAFSIVSTDKYSRIPTERRNINKSIPFRIFKSSFSLFFSRRYVG